MKIWAESQHKCRIIGFILISLFGLYLTVAWASYSAWDNSWSMANSSLNGVINKTGYFGAWWIDFFYALFGRITFLIPFTLLLAPLYFLFSRKVENITNTTLWQSVLAFFLFLLGLSACTHFLVSAGGALGGLFFSLLSSLLGDLFALLISAITLVIGFYFCSGQTLFRLTADFFHWVTEDPDAEKKEEQSTINDNNGDDFAMETEADPEKQTTIRPPENFTNAPSITDPEHFVTRRPTIIGLHNHNEPHSITENEAKIEVSLPPNQAAEHTPTFNPNEVINPAHFVTRTVSASKSNMQNTTDEKSLISDELPQIVITLPQDDSEEHNMAESNTPLSDSIQHNTKPVQVQVQLETENNELLPETSNVDSSVTQANEKQPKAEKNIYPKGYDSSLLHPLLAQQHNKTKPTTPFPTLDLFSTPPKPIQHTNEQEILETSKRIEKALADFKIKATVEDVLVGPVVTRYEIQPAAGIKASRIVGLAPDLARYLMAKAIRITDFVPGKPYIGVEIPNKQRETVWLRDVFATDEFRQSKMTLPMALGQDISGKPVIVNMEAMPHLLVAGQTGGGKSVGINTMILSLLYKRTPDELRFIMIDPKATELSIYNDIPHLLTPVVTDMKKAENALRWAVEEMERRYLLLTALKVRNIEGFNAKIRQADEEYGPIPNPIWKPGDTMDTMPPPLEKMSYIVLVVDEFADLLMVAGKQVESYIMRIAQKARAAGIHLILATQRPSTDVITGVIKANIPSRIAFTVASQFDSRTILGTGGAENLLGRGDMLFSANGSPEIIRVHGAYMTDEDVEKIADDWRARGKPNYMESILENYDDNENGNENASRDDLDQLFDEVAALVIDTQKVSASLIQRRFQIGFNRAARIVEQLEEQGIVSAPNNRGIREVLAR